MQELEIKVKHRVSPDPDKCTYGGDFWGKDVCLYHTHRDRTHGKKAPTERNIPKCVLFGKWLEKPYQKCEECKQACGEGPPYQAALRHKSVVEYVAEKFGIGIGDDADGSKDRE